MPRLEPSLGVNRNGNTMGALHLEPQTHGPFRRARTFLWYYSRSLQEIGRTTAKAINRKTLEDREALAKLESQLKCRSNAPTIPDLLIDM
jgi:hypothetical protein